MTRETHYLPVFIRQRCTFVVFVLVRSAVRAIAEDVNLSEEGDLWNDTAQESACC